MAAKSVLAVGNRPQVLAPRDFSIGQLEGPRNMAELPSEQVAQERAQARAAVFVLVESWKSLIAVFAFALL